MVRTLPVPVKAMGLALALPLLLGATPDAPEAALRLTPSPDAALPLGPPPPAAAPAATPVASPGQSWEPQRISFSNQVTASFGLAYANLRGYRPLTLDLYQPGATGTGAGPGALPLVVFVHGGGWNGGDSRHAAAFDDLPRALAALAARGYVVASVNYRLSGEARFPAAVQDVKAAISWLRGQAQAFNIDVTRAAVWGEGAGGQLAALAGVTCGVEPFQPAVDKAGASDCVQAVIDWGGATDLETLAADARPAGDAGFKPVTSGFTPPPSTDAGDFLGCEPARCAPMLARLASPMAFLSATAPAFLIQHGADDAVVPVAQSRKLYDGLRNAGAVAELVVYPGVGQDFRKGGVIDTATLGAAEDKMLGFLAATFPPIPLGPRLAQPRGSLY
jgi:acetyl esterase/lipase